MNIWNQTPHKVVHHYSTNSFPHWGWWLVALLLFWPALPFLLAYGLIVKKHYVVAYNKDDVVVYTGTINSNTLQALSLMGVVEYQYNRK